MVSIFTSLVTVLEVLSVVLLEFVPSRVVKVSLLMLVVRQVSRNVSSFSVFLATSFSSIRNITPLTRRLGLVRRNMVASRLRS